MAVEMADELLQHASSTGDKVIQANLGLRDAQSQGTLPPLWPPCGTIGRESDAANAERVVREGMHGLARRQIPDMGSHASAPRSQTSAVGRESQTAEVTSLVWPSRSASRLPLAMSHRVMVEPRPLGQLFASRVRKASALGSSPAKRARTQNAHAPSRSAAARRWTARSLRRANQRLSAAQKMTVPLSPSRQSSRATGQVPKAQSPSGSDTARSCPSGGTAGFRYHFHNAAAQTGGSPGHQFAYQLTGRCVVDSQPAPRRR